MKEIDFAISVRVFIKTMNQDFCNRHDLTQLLRASGSVGANYIEANECLSKKNFIYRIKI